MPQESPHATNDAINSSALGKKFVLNQEVNFVSEKHSLVLYTSMKLSIFLCHIFFCHQVALSNLNQPTLSDTSATVMVQNTL